jgi:hypothetical protein
MTLPYRLSLIGLLLAGITFIASPWWTMQSISRAASANDNEQWQRLVKREGFDNYADKMLSGLLELKMAAESNKNAVVAMRNYQESLKTAPKTVQQLTGPQGFSHLLCGDLLSEPNTKPAGTTGCWALNGKLAWESPQLVKVTFNNPETQWQSSITLLRVGLFSWQADGIELPIRAIIERYAKSAGLNKNRISDFEPQSPSGAGI